jgi:nucleoside phosphorylase
MILLTAALYCEAQPFIQHYQLKKDMSFTRFQVFRNDDILLLITGTGSMQAAIGTASVCSVLSPTEKDIFINIGVCGLKGYKARVGSVFLGNKIVDLATGRCFYPDLIYSHPFMEGTILTSPTILQKDAFVTGFEPIAKLTDHSGNYLIDMESAGFYQAASCFYQVHQLFFIKVVSDFLDSSSLTAGTITDLVGKKVPQITEWMEGIIKEIGKRRTLFTDKEENYITWLSGQLYLSVSMEQQLRQILKYVKLQDGNFIDRIELFLQNQKPCKSKKEGKKYLEQIRQLFI